MSNQKITAGGVVSHFASGLHTVRGITIDGSGNLYVTNQGDSSISKITPAGVVSMVASGFNSPYGISTDTSGNLYIANNGSNMVSKILSPIPLCDSYTFGDSVYTASGMYSHTFIKADGCDSVVTLALTLGDCISEIKDVRETEHIFVYPNPSSGVFTVTSDIQQGGVIEVYTVTGVKIYTHKVSSFVKNEINLSDKAKGIYVVKVSNGNKL